MCFAGILIVLFVCVMNLFAMMAFIAGFHSVLIYTISGPKLGCLLFVSEGFEVPTIRTSMSLHTVLADPEGFTQWQPWLTSLTSQGSIGTIMGDLHPSFRLRPVHPGPSVTQFGGTTPKPGILIYCISHTAS